MNPSLWAAQIIVQFGKAVEYAKQAFTKGELDNEGNLYLAEGMAQLNLKHYEQAIESFEQAAEIEGAERSAKQWLKYAKSQHKQQQQMANLQ